MRLLVASLIVCLAGCGTARVYDGERREPDEVARIIGDYPITAGAPVTVTLRQVDDRKVGLGENAVEVLPGVHRLLVDCRIAETERVSRHFIDADVYAGRRYRLVAETSAGLRECTSVSLQALD